MGTKTKENQTFRRTGNRSIEFAIPSLDLHKSLSFQRLTDCLNRVNRKHYSL